MARWLVVAICSLTLLEVAFTPGKASTLSLSMDEFEALRSITEFTDSVQEQKFGAPAYIEPVIAPADADAATAAAPANSTTPAAAMVNSSTISPSNGKNGSPAGAGGAVVALLSRARGEIANAARLRDQAVRSRSTDMLGNGRSSDWKDSTVAARGLPRPLPVKAVALVETGSSSRSLSRARSKARLQSQSHLSEAVTARATEGETEGVSVEMFRAVAAERDYFRSQYQELNKNATLLGTKLAVEQTSHEHVRDRMASLIERVHSTREEWGETTMRLKAAATARLQGVEKRDKELMSTVLKQQQEIAALKAELAENKGRQVKVDQDLYIEHQQQAESMDALQNLTSESQRRGKELAMLARQQKKLKAVAVAAEERSRELELQQRVSNEQAAALKSSLAKAQQDRMALIQVLDKTKRVDRAQLQTVAARGASIGERLREEVKDVKGTLRAHLKDVSAQLAKSLEIQEKQKEEIAALREANGKQRNSLQLLETKEDTQLGEEGDARYGLEARVSALTTTNEQLRGALKERSDEVSVLKHQLGKARQLFKALRRRGALAPAARRDAGVGAQQPG